MISNYHTHTARCRHATGLDEEYIKKAIAEGIKVLGFADHAPYIYRSGYVSYYKMTPEQAPEYISSLTALKEKYKDKIEIHIGFEAEYYPTIWNRTLEFWKSLRRVEYLILGQHYTYEEYPTETALHSFDGFADTAPVTEYVNTVIEAVKTKKFTYVAHPDVINYTGGDLDFYRSEMRRMLAAVTEADIPLELNILGLASHRNYPTPEFWKTAAEFPVHAILGCDAHDPNSVADKKDIARALRFADKYKINLTDTVKLVNPFD